MSGLPFAHCCSLSTVKTFVRFASQIFFCYHEKVYNQHYDLVFLKVTVFSTCLLVQHIYLQSKQVLIEKIISKEKFLRLLQKKKVFLSRGDEKDNQEKRF